MKGTQNDIPDDRAEIFTVGDLRIDTGLQRVSRGEQEIPLPNLSFKLLLALVRAAPNFLSNEMLMERVWPGIVVSPETVS
jgi:DNA-binding winged helix-turn-helix (wHTH) protein